MKNILRLALEKSTKQELGLLPKKGEKETAG
jgi:hypothetical protein